MAAVNPTAAMATNQAARSAQNLSFPRNINNVPMYTRMVFAKYERTRPSSQRQDTTTATIILPLPEVFGDTQSARWGDTELGLFGNSLSGIGEAINGMKKTGGDIAAMFQAGEKTQGTLAALKALGLTAMALSPKSMRDGQIQGRISQELGAVPNPHLTLLYDGQALRTHNLAWRFSPHTEQEARELGRIINAIRIQALPSFNRTVGKFALDYPSTVAVEFQGVDKDYKTKIFKSAVKDVQTNLSPNGLTFYPNGRPVEITLEISLVETEIVTREDFTGTTA